MTVPRVTFGIIVLNGEPFTRYNLRALYPFAHEIIVAEGASPKAAHIAMPDGHSIDGTLDILRAFKKEEDPGNKIVIVTAEDEGYPNGFWPGEKDEQSQAYAKRATGDWLWQVDIDEFYQPADMERLFQYLQEHPETTCVTFNAYHFWGDFDYLLEGGLFMSYRFQSEPGGAYRRIFRWGPGYRYTTHRPPTVLDPMGRDLTVLRKVNATARLHPPMMMYHYTNLFPCQVIPKGVYYSNQGWAVGIAQKIKFENFMAPLTVSTAFRIYDHFGTYNWLRRFVRQHPPAINELRSDIEKGLVKIETRRTEDIEEVLRSHGYQRVVQFLYVLEWLRGKYHHGLHEAKLALKSLILDTPVWMVPVMKVVIPKRWKALLPKRIKSGRANVAP